MWNTLKNWNNQAPNPERRDFLTKWAALAAMGILWVWLPWCRTQADREEEVTKIQPMSNLKYELLEMQDLNEWIKNTIEKLMLLYESLELKTAKDFYITNEVSGNIYLLNIVAVALNDMSTSQLVKIDDNTKQKMNNMIFKVESKFTASQIIIDGLDNNPGIFAKKYPQLVPVIEEWKKKNWK